MINQNISLLEEIEQSRKEMHDLVKQKKYSLLSPEVIAISVYIDRLMNEYEEMKTKKSSNSI